MTVKELREKRAKLIADARAIADKAVTEKRDMNAEETGQFDTLMADSDKVLDQVTRREKLEAAERSLAESAGRKTEGEQPGRKPDAVIEGRSHESKSDAEKRAEEYAESFEVYLRDGNSGLTLEERRDLTAGSNVKGGYLLAPQEMVAGLIKAVDNLVLLRQLATKYTVDNADSLGAASLDADPADSDWTSELATGSEDSTMAFGKRELQPHPLAKRIKVSRTLLRKVPSVAGLVQERLAYKTAVTEEQAFMTGNGASKPLGVFVASDDGIPTSRDVSTDNTATAVTFDGLINAKYSLKAQYLKSPSLRWIVHRDLVKMVRKLKDLNGQYIWQPSVVVGDPDRILDVPVLMSEYAPSTFTASQYVGIIGDFSNYWIADALSMTIQRLEELYAETNQVGFITRMETDGMPVLAEAFARVKLAAS